MHWAEKYIGLPYSDTGEGPSAFHCWAFVRLVQGEHYARGLPIIPNPVDVLAQVRLLNDHAERNRWAQVDAPADGDCVLMSQNKRPFHVGVWVDVDGVGGVLHCAPGDGGMSGGMFQRIDQLRLNGWNITGFYRFKDDWKQ